MLQILIIGGGIHGVHLALSIYPWSDSSFFTFDSQSICPLSLPAITVRWSYNILPVDRVVSEGAERHSEIWQNLTCIFRCQWYVWNVSLDEFNNISQLQAICVLYHVILKSYLLRCRTGLSDVIRNRWNRWDSSLITLAVMRSSVLSRSAPPPNQKNNGELE